MRETNGYGVCPDEWIFDPRIKNELRLLIKISGLTAKDGYCYASNEYFAELFKADKITPQTVSEKIKKLERLGYIKIDYKKRGAEITRREIRLSKSVIDDSANDEPTIKQMPKENIINKDEYSYAHAREKNQTSLNAPTLKENPNENFKNRPLNENQVGYGVEKSNLASKPTLEAKPSLVATKSNATSDYVSYTSPKNYATEKEWYAALKMTDLMGWNIEGILYTHLIPYLEDKRGRPLQDFEIRRISAELAKYVGVSQLEIVRRCIKGGFREIKPFGTDKLRKDYPDMCWELGDNYEI
jgi:hypothetical protein|nr:MAG TPA: helix-turn-helix domain protein [Caudoviricetes sp.]